jgi:hypothetical protein
MVSGMNDCQGFPGQTRRSFASRAAFDLFRLPGGLESEESSRAVSPCPRSKVRLCLLLLAAHPLSSVPFEETLEEMNKLYNEGYLWVLGVAQTID